MHKIRTLFLSWDIEKWSLIALRCAAMREVAASRATVPNSWSCWSCWLEQCFDFMHNLSGRFLSRVVLGGSEKERKGGRNGRTIACDVCLSPGPRAARAFACALRPLTIYAWRLNGEHMHSNAHTVDLDHDEDRYPTRNEQTTTCRSCREVLSEQEVNHFCIEKERKQDEEENERGRDRERRLGAANLKCVSG